LYEVQVSDVEERTETSVDLGMRAATRAESRMLIDGPNSTGRSPKGYAIPPS
jgi:hypothetical protein